MSKDVDVLIVKSKLKEYIKGLGDYNVSGDFYEKFNILVAKMAKKAAKRAQLNGRKTVSARDV